MLLGREPVGDATVGIAEEVPVGGTVMAKGPGNLETRGGEDGRAVCDAAGDADLNVREGEPGRAMRDIVDAAGLAGRGIPPDFPTDGDSGREPPLARRVTRAGCAGVWYSDLAGLLGPETRRRRSSSCVLSFGESGPTNVHTFSPTNAYASLWMTVSQYSVSD
jgi:hypothetical protein